MGRKRVKAELAGVFYNEQGQNFQNVAQELFKAYIKSRQCGEKRHEQL